MLIIFETHVHFPIDPSPWLLVSDELKEKNKAKPYDPKKSVWVTNKVLHRNSSTKTSSTDETSNSALCDS